MNNINKKEGILNRCTGCQVCAALCPNDAITIQLDEEGFYMPSVNLALCSNCGQCVTCCYKYDKSIVVKDECQAVFSASSQDATILESTTSGGIAYELSTYFIDRGYKVCGVSYDYNKDIAFTEIVETKKQLERLKGSKYIQTYSETAFCELLKENHKDKYAVFGLPCHIYALDKALKQKRRRSQVVLIDLFCHGCPSMSLWKKTISSIRENISNITHIEFRSKKKGWHEFCLYAKNEKKEYISKGNMDFFYTFFFDNQVLNRACYECKLRSTLQYGDIRLGDFWGSQYELNKKGVSAVVCVSKRGFYIFNDAKRQCAFNISQHELREVIKPQSYGDYYMLNEGVRKLALNLLNSDLETQNIRQQYIKTYSLNKKIRLKLKQIYQLLPNQISDRIRLIYHKM